MARKNLPNSFSGGQSGKVVALTSTSAILVDLARGNNFSLTATANITLTTPPLGLAAAIGQSGSITITQDSTGSRTIAATGVWQNAGGGGVTLTTTTGAVDRIDYYVASTGAIHYALGADVKA